MMYAGSIYRDHFKDLASAKNMFIDALNTGCPVAADYIHAIEGNKHFSPRHIELLSLAAKAGGISAKYSLAVYLEDTSPQEALFWDQQAEEAVKARADTLKAPIFDITSFCMN